MNSLCNLAIVVAICLIAGANQSAYSQFGSDAFAAPNIRTYLSTIGGLATEPAVSGDQKLINRGPASGVSSSIVQDSFSSDDATSIKGINTAGTVRVCNLANLEALLNLIANGAEIVGVLWGLVVVAIAFRFAGSGAKKVLGKVCTGAILITCGLMTPPAINWLVALARDNNLFS